MPLTNSFFKDKKKTGRNNHRWTEYETNLLLNDIIRVMKNFGHGFEKPTCKTFYNDLCNKNLLPGVDWMAKKHKLRHLKSSYKKAKEWKESVGSELFESDKPHISSRIKRMCPFYNKLDEIFGAILNSDPIGPLILDEEVTADYSITSDIKDHSIEYTIDDATIPKIESNAFNDEYDEMDDGHFEEEEQVESEAEESAKEHPESTTNFLPNSVETHNYAKPKNQANNSHSKSTKTSSYSEDIEKMKLCFEREKFERRHKLEKEKFERMHNLEKEKLEFERTKFYEIQRIRKYEFDKEFELRKLEILKGEEYKSN